MTKLTIVPTPIGNLDDITLRALAVLRHADIVLAEDTRTSSKLLKHHGVETRLQPYHKFNEHKSLQRYIEQIKSGANLALISDAGTPGISDPGFLLVRECVQNNIEVECLPGPTALIPALVVSGLPCDRFMFEGFLPHKKGRKSRLERISEQQYTVVLYESCHRLVKTLNELAQHCNENRQVVVAKELTKLHEEIWRGTLAEVLKDIVNKTVKGEYVIVLEGSK